MHKTRYLAAVVTIGAGKKCAMPRLKALSGGAPLGLLCSVLLTVAVGILGGCPGDETTQCGTQRCAAGYKCDEVHEQCVIPDQLEVCKGLPDGSECVIGGDNGYVCDQEVCVESRCGDGILDTNRGEQCDDGAANSNTEPNACRLDCRPAWCGDGVVDTGEECDEGSNNSDSRPDACRDDCRSARCGDGVVDNGEECDDGSNNSDLRPDACRTACVLPRCGDGVVDAGEECDDGSANSDTDSDACRTDCRNPICGDGVVDTGEECDDGNETDWDGCTNCSITEFRVNTTVDGDQGEPYGPGVPGSVDVAMAPDGRFVVVWAGPDGDETGIFGQLYDAEGGEVGGEFQVNTYTIDSQTAPAVTMAPDGSFVVVWQSMGQDWDDWGIFAQRFSADGQPVGVEFQVNSTTTSFQTDPAVSSSQDGRFIIVWRCHQPDIAAHEMFAQRYDSDGLPTGGEFQVNPGQPFPKFLPQVAMISDGRFVVSYSDWDAQADIFVRLFDAQAHPATDRIKVNSYVDGDQVQSSNAVAPDGHFVVVWTNPAEDGSGLGVYGRRVNADGTFASSEFRVNDYTSGNQDHSFVAMAPDGSFVVVWQSEGQDGSGYGVFCQIYNPQGGRVGSQFRVNAFTDNDQGLPRVAIDQDGNFLVVWRSMNQVAPDSEGDIFAQRFDAQGNRLPWGQ